MNTFILIVRYVIRRTLFTIINSIINLSLIGGYAAYLIVSGVKSEIRKKFHKLK